MAAQLFQLAPHHDAKLYYSTMVQDESRHTEAWLRLAEDAGGTVSATRTSIAWPRCSSTSTRSRRRCS